MNIQDLLVKKGITLKEAIKQIDKNAQKIVFVVDEKDRLIGSLSDGDVRRWILKDGSLQEKVEKVCNKNPFFVYENYDLDKIKDIVETKRITHIPVVNEKKVIKDIIKADYLFKERLYFLKEKLDAEVVIMAGGKGTRLDPFTRILPKPLIPIGDKTSIECIIERFLRYNVKQFYITLNYKAEVIKSYFEEIKPPYQLIYIEEEKPLGTIGALRLLYDRITTENIFLTNCDVIIDADYIDILRHHKRNQNHITVVVSLKHYKIQYSICESKNGELIKIVEKPEFDFLVNTGMYIINKSLLKLIPQNSRYDAPQFIEKAKQKGYKVGIYPVSNNSWTDVGEWSEYRKVLIKMGFF